MTNRLKWIAFENDHIHKPLEFWRTVIFSDEAKFCIFGIKCKLVWRKPCTAIQKEHLVPTVTYLCGFRLVSLPNLCASTPMTGRNLFLVPLWKTSFPQTLCGHSNPMIKLKCHPAGVVRKLEEGVPAQVSSSSLDHGSKLQGPSPEALE
ncbi:hypothetical protein TNCV_4599471 [Trichonephila clavipes]|nr:hypothetical protein TNCV_4599471 [Trichonephila clavipes]